jgi:hypothetical protein
VTVGGDSRRVWAEIELGMVVAFRSVDALEGGELARRIAAVGTE